MLIPVIILGGLGVLFAAFLTYFSVRFKVQENPVAAKIYELLPQANCGACGSPGCSAFAEMLAEGTAGPEKCVMLEGDNLKEACSLIGVDARVRGKRVARLKCSGGRAAKKKFTYTTIKSCNGVEALLGTSLECGYGCLGYGDCVRVCPVDAILIGEDELPRIDMENCIGCGKCVEECPKGLICLQPADKKVYVACSSKEKGASVVRACKSGCIGCGKCVKECPEGAISMVDNLAVIDYVKCTGCQKCVDSCPRRVIYVSS